MVATERPLNSSITFHIYKVSPLMGCDNSWPTTVTVPTDPFTTFTSPTGPILSEWVKCQPGNAQNGGTILPIANLMADSELGSLVSYLSFLVTIDLSRLVSEIFICDRQTDGWTMQTITTV